MTLSVLSFLTGWDEGCMTMTLGERSKLYVAGHKGYGAGGFPAWKYPPNHSLKQWNILCGVVGLQLHVCGSLVPRPPPFFLFFGLHSLLSYKWWQYLAVIAARASLEVPKAKL